MSSVPDRGRLLRETLLFDWTRWNPAVAWRSAPALALALTAGIAAGSPGAGLAAAAGAFTTGLGSLQTIGGSCLIPMLLAAVGMAASTFVGMVLGHQSVLFVLAAGVWAGGYALLTSLKGGTSWVGLQCTVFLLVSSAFHTSPRGALGRCALILAGGLLQTLITWAVLRVTKAPCGPDVPDSAPEPGLRDGLATLRHHLSLRTAVGRYSARMALVVMAATEVYRHTGFVTGAWVPMTTLLVVRPDLIQTLTRGTMRVSGTLLGAGLAGVVVEGLHPPPVMLAVLVCAFAWCAFATLNVNYSLFTLNLTAYIVFLLALARLPAATVVQRRAFYTLLGGAIALLAYVDVFWRTRRWIRAERATVAEEAA